ncbi:MAG: N-acetylneuraminate synthase [Pelagibacteraceae bacterium TMED65]|nr:MAG: N-acetylneuraminate synthase [Pelagibacteraceae bacterium TMED65]
MKISDINIRQGSDPLIIAEIGVNHNGNTNLAHELIAAAADSGADAVKFQTFDVDSLVSETAPQADYQKVNTGKVESQKSMLSKLVLPDEVLPSLKEYAESKNLIFLSSPFDINSAEYLAQLGVSAIKIPSGEITNKHYLEKIGTFDIPVILSTGMSSLGEIETALETLHSTGAVNICLLHCVSQYPAPPSSMNLRAITSMAAAFNIPVGLSDHSEGIVMPIAAVALGACVIEKHFTINKNMCGPDHRASLNPDEFRAMTRAIEDVRLALGNGVKKLQPIEENTRLVARKSIVAAKNLSKGDRISSDMICIKRPGDGLGPHMMPHVINRRLARSVKKDCQIALSDLE